MQIDSIYSYDKIERTSVDGHRLYNTKTGPLPSVTTILDKTKSTETVNGLQRWRDRIGNEKADRIQNQSANVGTIMHDAIERWIKNIDPNSSNNFVHKMGKRMADVIINNLKIHLTSVWGSEVSLYYPDLYAGTSDLIGLYKNRPTIMDFKQSNKLKKREWIQDYLLQAAAYAMAHNELYNTDIKSGAIFVCTQNLEFQLFELHPREFDYYGSEWSQRVDQYYSNVLNQ